MSAYKEISTKLMNYLSENTLDMRIFSIDEAFVEITWLAEMNKMSLDKYLLYLQQDILKKVGIPVSIWVSNTKLKAKVFSKINKPFWIFRWLDQETEKTAFSKISFREIPFIGSKTAKKLDFYILSIQDYIDIWYFDIIQRFGKTWWQIWLELRGVSSMWFSSTKTSKTMGRARAFNREMTQNKKILLSHLKSNLSRLCDELYVRWYEIKNIEIMLIDNNWVKYKKQYLLPVYTSDRKILLQIAVKLLESLYDCRILYRKTWVFTSCIQSIHNKQLSIFTSENKSHSKSLWVEKLFQEIQEKYWKDSLKLWFAGMRIPSPNH